MLKNDLKNDGIKSHLLGVSFSGRTKYGLIIYFKRIYAEKSEI
jgi:hypothetical protein